LSKNAFSSITVSGIFCRHLVQLIALWLHGNSTLTSIKVTFQRKELVRVPSKDFSCLFDVGQLIEMDQIDGQTSHDGLHQRDLTCSCATGIFLKADIFNVV
jgi:hypothetical protein